MKTNVLKFYQSHFLHSQLITENDTTTISEVPETKFWGVQIDNHLIWKYHVDRILTNLSTTGFVIRQVVLCTKSGNLTNGIFCLL